MSDQPSGRDEKGLTLSGRTMLRLLVEFERTLRASRKLGNETAGYELIQSPTVLLEVRDLLWIASQMAERIGSKEDLESYLKNHAESDAKSIRDVMDKEGKEITAKVLSQKCTSCGEFICPSCQECHFCGKKDEHEEVPPLGPPEGEILN